MTKMKKLLCLALVITLLSSLICISASAEVTEAAKVTFAGGAYDSTASIGNADPSFLGGVYGKAEDDYSAAFLNAEGDKFFSVGTGADGLTVEEGGKLKISYDLASNDFHSASKEGGTRATHGRYVSMKINDGGRFVILGPNGYTLDDGTTNQRGTYSKLNDYAWNNITAIFEFNEDNSAADYKLYVNGKQVHRNEAYAVRLPKKVNDFRVGGVLISTDEVYYDNFVVEAYGAEDEAPAINFTTDAAALEGNEALVDATEKVINISDVEMTVADFRAATENFMVLNETGAVADDSDYIAYSTVYAVCKDGVNTYYDKYEFSIEPPVIEATTNEFKEIVNSDTKEIRLVDRMDLTVGEFLANTEGATVTLLDGNEASDDTLLKNCRVSAVLGSIYDIEYTLVTARSYALENETFDGTYSQRTSGNGKIYVGNDIQWNGQTNGKAGVKFDEAIGLGGKDDTDKSLALSVENAGSAGDVFMYLNNPYSLSKTELSSTFTMEGKLFIDGVDDTDISSIDVVVNGRVAIKLLPDGKIMTTDGTVLAPVTWENGKWLPFAITQHKATNRINVFVGGIDAKCSWTAGPFQADIRLRPMLKEGASFTFAVDDVKMYTDSIEKVKYDITEDAVTMTSTFNLSGAPILAVYDEDGKLNEVKIGKDANTVTINYEEGQSVKAFLWGKDSKLGPWTEKVTVVDRGNLVNALTASLSKAFTDNMVLQCDMPVTVWGTSADANGSTLAVTLGNETKTAYVNDGEWEVEFSEREASADGVKLTVATASGTETVNNIAFGDVYFVGGQSNAYLPMNTVDTYAADKASFTKSDEIRIFHQVGNYASTVQENPVEGSKWEYATESTIGKMSAIGMYFAKTLKENGVDKPIGLISVARSGSSLHWNIPSSITAKYQIGYMTDKTNQAYNALMAPVEKFSAKGMLWYQGENDSIKGSTDIISQSTEIYKDMFSDFHSYLKQTTKNNDFKMFTVQLSSHPSEQMLAGNPTTGWQLPWFRSYQYDISKNVDDVYLIPSQDCGYRKDDDDAAHPDYKKPIGERLAKAALYAIYGTETENNALSPMPDSISYDGNTVTIKFKNVAEGLKLVTGDELKGFEIIDENGNAVDAVTIISGKDTVVITSDAVTEAKGVRYAFYRAAANTIANLTDSNGLPCPTFTHDKGADNGSKSQKIAPLSDGVMLD